MNKQGASAGVCTLPEREVTAQRERARGSERQQVISLPLLPRVPLPPVTPPQRLLNQDFSLS